MPTRSASEPSVAPPRYILCSLDPVISYAAPKPGQAETAANAFDTYETIGDRKNPKRGTIEYHNLAVTAACGQK